MAASASAAAVTRGTRLRCARPTMLCIHLVIIYRRTSDRSNFALRRTARKLTAHAHRCVKLKQGRPLHARPGQGKLIRLLGCYWLSGKLIGSLTYTRFTYVATCCNTALVVQFSVIAYAMSASAAAVTRYQASLRSPHNALHSPSWGEPERAPHRRESCDFLYKLCIMVRRTALFKRMRRCALPVNLE